MNLFYILLDLECPLGSTSRLAKILKDNGLDPRLLSHNTIRLRITERYSTDNLTMISSKVKNLFSIIENHRETWRTLCVETWIERPMNGFITTQIAKIKDTCIYIRPGAKKRTVLKLAWINHCQSKKASLIPESITRLCIQSKENNEIAITTIQSKIIEFLDVIKDTFNASKSS